ncbi:Protein CBG04082 [Caenorhabditis briggsae]|uniref:Probable ATP-dependent RNA helicase spindle-E n=1 Tax=Caenorhabditis briggsae TaxID=6238 RepID=A8WW62_CAEBR|nr:Protein CBG04082 [Caenorhabditis briggsae]CAP24871.1 Protein CBG04082 [Caenorhabditis briggsae]
MHITLDVMSREQRKVMHEVAQHNGLSTRSTGKEPNRCIILSYLLKSIDDNEVVIISGGTGCGKTTQVPQFILDDAAEKKKKVRIMVTQPRRLAAISISERVAKERGESLGHTVGYKIRLENRSSEKTLLTYCTTGVLLRMLTSDPIASGITHIIMDEIHEREINTDYLLIALRECLKHRKDLKVILMSATIEGNMQLFSSYFQNQSVDVLRIESRTFDVKTFYIDQILAMSGYQPPEHQVFFSGVEFKTEEWEEEIKEIQKEDKRSNNSETKNGSVATNTQIKKTSGSNTCAEGVVNQQRGINSVTTAVGNKWSSGQYTCSDGEIIDEKTMGLFFKSTGCPKIPALTVEFLPDSRDSVYVNGVRYNTDKTQSQVLLEKQKLDRNSMPEYPVMYRLDETHSTSRLAIPEPTTLCSESVQITQELFADASPTSIEKTNTPSTASSGLAKFSTDDFGKFGEKQRISQMLEQRFRSELKSVIPQRTSHYDTDMDKLVERIDFAKLRFAEKYDMFYGTDFENSIDHHLLDHVIQYLADSPVFGTILVFLPGFDDIQLMMGKIDKWKLGLKNMKHVSVIPLHSQMHSINHSDVFKPVTSDIRKIILATNIAEASITIEDVIFVVDTGKVKEKSYNHEAKLSTLSVKPIARSNAEQRSGRAGRVRNGYCIRLYSEAKFNSMPETQMAEMKRAAIYDVTLHAKIFAPNCMKISEFLALAPEPPEEKSIIQSMAFLEQLGAFYRPNNDSGQNEDENENEETTEEVDPELTDLGRLMARLPLDPQLSRMLLFGLSLKCLAPIVNLVALLASREPYVLAQSDERERQSKMKFEMAEQDFSDHLMYIRLCTAFCSKVTYKEQNDFCREHLLNLATMKMVQGTRHQLLQELVRAKVIVAPEKDIMMLLSDSNYNAHSNSWTMVQAAIAAGCYPSIGVSTADSNLKKVQTLNVSHDIRSIALNEDCNCDPSSYGSNFHWSNQNQASNQYVNRNQRNNSTAQPTKTLNSDSHFTARIPPENGYLPNINTSNHQQITSSIGNSVPETQSAASSSIYHHHDQNWTSNPHSYHTNEYGYDYGSNSVYQYGGNQQLGNAQQYTSFNSSNPGSFMSSMGGYTPRGGRGRTGNCSKPENLFVDQNDCLRIGDFGLARFSDPDVAMTPESVSLWYRPIEILLGATNHTTAVDIWSAGINKIIKVLGKPTTDEWPTLNDLPAMQYVTLDGSDTTNFEQAVPQASEKSLNIIRNMIRFDPTRRFTATQLLQHDYFGSEDSSIRNTSMDDPEFP